MIKGEIEIRCYKYYLEVVFVSSQCVHLQLEQVNLQKLINKYENNPDLIHRFT